MMFSSIPRFSGINPEVWISAMESFLFNSHILPHQYVQYAMQFLEGEAFTWARPRELLFLNNGWHYFVSHLLWQFETPYNDDFNGFSCSSLETTQSVKGTGSPLLMSERWEQALVPKTLTEVPRVYEDEINILKDIQRQLAAMQTDFSELSVGCHQLCDRWSEFVEDLRDEVVKPTSESEQEHSTSDFIQEEEVLVADSIQTALASPLGSNQDNNDQYMLYDADEPASMDAGISVMTAPFDIIVEDVSLKFLVDKESGRAEEDVVEILSCDPVMVSHDQVNHASAVPFMDLVSFRMGQADIGIFSPENVDSSNDISINSDYPGSIDRVLGVNKGNTALQQLGKDSNEEDNVWDFLQGFSLTKWCPVTYGKATEQPANWVQQLMEDVTERVVQQEHLTLEWEPGPDGCRHTKVQLQFFSCLVSLSKQVILQPRGGIDIVDWITLICQTILQLFIGIIGSTVSFEPDISFKLLSENKRMFLGNVGAVTVVSNELVVVENIRSYKGNAILKRMRKYVSSVWAFSSTESYESELIADISNSENSKVDYGVIYSLCIDPGISPTTLDCWDMCVLESIQKSPATDILPMVIGNVTFYSGQIPGYAEEAYFIAYFGVPRQLSSTRDPLHTIRRLNIDGSMNIVGISLGFLFEKLGLHNSFLLTKVAFVYPVRSLIVFMLQLLSSDWLLSSIHRTSLTGEHQGTNDRCFVFEMIRSWSTVVIKIPVYLFLTAWPRRYLFMRNRSNWNSGDTLSLWLAAYSVLAASDSGGCIWSRHVAATSLVASISQEFGDKATEKKKMSGYWHKEVQQGYNGQFLLQHIADTLFLPLYWALVGFKIPKAHIQILHTISPNKGVLVRSSVLINAQAIYSTYPTYLGITQGTKFQRLWVFFVITNITIQASFVKVPAVVTVSIYRDWISDRLQKNEHIVLMLCVAPVHLKVGVVEMENSSRYNLLEELDINGTGIHVITELASRNQVLAWYIVTALDTKVGKLKGLLGHTLWQIAWDTKRASLEVERDDMRTNLAVKFAVLQEAFKLGEKLWATYFIPDIQLVTYVVASQSMSLRARVKLCVISSVVTILGQQLPMWFTGSSFVPRQFEDAVRESLGSVFHFYQVQCMGLKLVCDDVRILDATSVVSSGGDMYVCGEHLFILNKISFASEGSLPVAVCQFNPPSEYQNACTQVIRDPNPLESRVYVSHSIKFLWLIAWIMASIGLSYCTHLRSEWDNMHYRYVFSSLTFMGLYLSTVGDFAAGGSIASFAFSRMSVCNNLLPRLLQQNDNPPHMFFGLAPEVPVFLVAIASTSQDSLYLCYCIGLQRMWGPPSYLSTQIYEQSRMFFNTHVAELKACSQVFSGTNPTV